MCIKGTYTLRLGRKEYCLLYLASLGCYSGVLYYRHSLP